MDFPNREVCIFRNFIMNVPKVSIIITVHNRADLTLKCLESISANTLYDKWELIIVDNASSDETPNLLKSLEGDVKVLRSEENLGFSKGNNWGAKAAEGQLFCFLNNDTEVTTGWLNALADCLERHPGAAACSGKLLFPDMTVQHAGLVFDKADHVAYHVYRGLPKDAVQVCRERKLKAVTGACILIRREYFEAANGFDEGYINGYEDVDLCLQLGELRGEIYYTPGCEVIHHTSATPGRNENEEHNFLRYRQKWFDRIEPDEDEFLAADGYLAEWQGVNCTLKEVWCDIIIPVYNNPGYTRRCLEAVVNNTEYPRYKIIVVDNGSTDGTSEYLQSRDDINLIRNHENAGFAKACNQAAAGSRAEVLVFLNNDTEVRKGWLTELVKTMSDPSVSIAGSKLLYPDGTIQHAGVVFDKRDRIGYHLYCGQPGEAYYTARERDFKAVTGACMMVRRDDFSRAGGFDESYVNGREDIDLCLKVHRSGGRIVYNPRSVVVHYESKTAGRKDRDVENISRFLSVWRGEVEPDEDEYYSEDGFEVVWTTRNDYQLNYIGGRAAIVLTPVAGQYLTTSLKRMITGTVFPDYKIYLQSAPGIEFPEQLIGVVGKIDEPDIIEACRFLQEKLVVAVPSNFKPVTGWLSSLYLWGENNSGEELIIDGRPKFGCGRPSLQQATLKEIKYFRS